MPGYRVGVELLAALKATSPAAFAWREAPYEFVTDRPAIDLLAGGVELRTALEEEPRDVAESLSDWMESWRDDERTFRDERRAALLYAEER